MFCFQSGKQVKHFPSSVVQELASICEVFQCAVIIHGSEWISTMDIFLCGSEKTASTTLLSALCIGIARKEQTNWHELRGEQPKQLRHWLEGLH